MLHGIQKLNEVKNLVNKKDENQNIKFVPIQAHGTDKALEVIKLELILKLKINRNDWLLADTCPQAANH